MTQVRLPLGQAMEERRLRGGGRINERHPFQFEQIRPPTPPPEPTASLRSRPVSRFFRRSFPNGVTALVEERVPTNRPLEP